MPLDPDTLDQLKMLALGFAFAGLLGSAFELFTAERASFRLLNRGGAAAMACLPVVIFSAPFIIVRNTIRGRRFEGRSVSAVTMAAVVAGLWSLMCGRVLLDVTALVAGA